MKPWRAGFLVVALALMACGGGGTEPTPNNQQTPGGAGGGGGGGGSGPPSSATVTIGDNYFSPSSITVAVGGTVTWNWGGYNTHNVTFSGSDIAGSGNKSSGTYEHTFATAGTFNYTCTQHAAMDGKVVVQ